MRCFGAVVGQSFIVKLTSTIGIEAQVELILPTKLEACLGESIVSNLRTGQSLRQVRCMRGNFVSDDARTNILSIWKTQMFLRSNVAEHRSSIPSDVCCTNRTGNVVVAGSDISNKWAQGIEGRFETLLQFFFHVFANELQRYVTWTFDPHLDVVLPRLLCQFTKRSQFCKLCLIVGVVNRTGTKPISQTKGHVVGLHDFANLIEIRIQKILPMVCEAPLRHNGAAARHDSR